MKRLLEVFALNAAQQRAIIFALSLVVAGVALKSFRDQAQHKRSSAPPPPVDQPSPSPGIRP